jgi:hypothetical protein
MDAQVIPAVVFTDPEIASAGLTAEEAEKRGHKVKVGKFPFTALGRAIANLDTDGFAKVVMDADSGLLLGVHVVGQGAGDLISEAALAIEMGAAAADLAMTIHPHPTLPEAIMEAAKAALGEAIHVLNQVEHPCASSSPAAPAILVRTPPHFCAHAAISWSCYDSLELGYRQAIGDTPLVVGNTRDGALVKQVIGDHKLEAVIHFAAYKAAGESVHQSRQVLRQQRARQPAAHRSGSAGRRAASSCSRRRRRSTARPASSRARRRRALRPENPYGESKLLVERMLKWFDTCFGMRSVFLRYFNAAGAALDGKTARIRASCRT